MKPCADSPTPAKILSKPTYRLVAEIRVQGPLLSLNDVLQKCSANPFVLTGIKSKEQQRLLSALKIGGATSSMKITEPRNFLWTAYGTLVAYLETRRLKRQSAKDKRKSEGISPRKPSFGFTRQSRTAGTPRNFEL